MYPHYLLPVLVEAPGPYLTRGGDIVRVKAVVGPGVFTAWARGEYEDGTPEAWRTSGRIFQNIESPNDIVASLLPAVGAATPAVPGGMEQISRSAGT